MDLKVLRRGSITEVGPFLWLTSGTLGLYTGVDRGSVSAKQTKRVVGRVPPLSPEIFSNKLPTIVRTQQVKATSPMRSMDKHIR